VIGSRDTVRWSNGVPGPGSNVWVASGNVTLTNDTPLLGSLTINGGTLTFTNWATQLIASNVTVKTNGKLTAPAHSRTARRPAGYI